MNKAFYIVGIVFSLIFMGIISYYAEEVSDARWDYLDSMYSSYDYGYSSYNYSMFSDNDDDLTVEGGLWSLFFIFSFIAIDLLGLLKIKTTTVKVLSIIGLSLSGIFLLWDIVMILNPSGISFDEVQPGFAFYATVMIAFTIVGLVQSVRFQKRQQQPSVSTSASNTSEEKDLLDS
jgi:hypothetical protein